MKLSGHRRSAGCFRAPAPVGESHCADVAGSLVAEDVGVEEADGVGREERGDESKRPHDQDDCVVHITGGHSDVSVHSGTWKPKNWRMLNVTT